ncbi:carbohydrate ABC transporter permease [Nonomuraea sp. KC401]|uniref:carbohydrate ABC transporter permease n=1 Tax=unclassified Nonomuraea TaxID=2593643 RepID=UPI0010FDE042|nr:carbohydrate ABC transporter permease [Nonomuraea sp. KC401]NBE94694.1 ABC transporter permease subunit [Nonomuraea sp. K271]TLF76122.1 carbohydrate ABC transporter permease [Nonomuraea sp. KC401]
MKRYTLLAALSVVFVAPLLWALGTSLKSQSEATRMPPTLFPTEPVTRAYGTIFEGTTQTPVLRWFANSLIAATLHMLLVLAVSSLAAYALARLEFRGKRLMFVVIVSTLLVPGFVFLIPQFLIIDQLGWLDSLTALIVPGAAGAFGVFFLRQFFLGLPRELDEAALVEGANHWQIFTRITLPLSKPALATLAVLSFLANWNDFIWPIFVIFSPEYFTLPPGLSILQGAYTIDYPVIMAGAVLAGVPVLILFALTQRYVIEGISRSGLKG